MRRPGYTLFNPPAFTPRHPARAKVEIVQPPDQAQAGWVAGLTQWASVFTAVIVLSGTIYFATVGSSQAGPNLQVIIMVGGGMGIGALFTAIRLSSGNRQKKQQVVQYKKYIQTLRMQLSVQNQSYAAQLRAIDPDPLRLEVMATGSEARHLWERQPNHPTFLRVRIGLQPTAEGGVEVVVPNSLKNTLTPSPLEQEIVELRDSMTNIHDTPGLIDLREAGVYGIAGPRSDAYGLACAILCQIAVHHSPEEVRVAILCGPSQVAAWHWAGWLPHLQSLDPDMLRPMLTGTTTDTGRMLENIREILTQRQERTKSGSTEEKAAARKPYLVFLIDDSPDMPIERTLLQRIIQDGPDQNIFSIFLTPTETNIPSAALAFANIQADKSMAVVVNQRDGSGTRLHWRPDFMAVETATRIARALAPLQLQQGGSTFVLPQTLNLFDVLAWPAVDGEQVAANWAQSAQALLEVTLGVRDDGKPLTINVDESVHGVHGVLAGATGTGKGELLLTYVTSLALNNHPSKLNFVLADFKGGATFRVFETLPHTVGLVTDAIDEFGLIRFMTSIRAELNRRKAIIDTAQRTYGAQVQKIRDYADVAPDEVFPFLLIVIDEFAELARTVPDMMNELVLIAQQGRSLGVFLVLSMQTTETLKGAIDRNVRYRIALRMNQKGDSRDLIGTDGAALISGRNRGRGYFRCDDDLFRFQTGRVMGHSLSRDPAATTQTTTPLVRRVDLCWNIEEAKTGAAVKKDLPVARGRKPRPDVEIAIDACIAALKIAPLTKALFIPWRQPLATNIPLTQFLPHVFAHDHFVGWNRREREWLTVPVAVQDRYWQQSQSVLLSGFRQGQHLQFLGVQDSGRTTGLLSTILALAATHTPDEIGFIFIDFGSTLSLFNALPHETDYYGPNQSAEAAALMTELADLLDQRRTLFAHLDGGRVANNLEDYRSYQQAHTIPPEEQVQPVFVVIDNYTAWMQSIADFRLTVGPTLKSLIQNGAAYGIYFLLTADRITDVISGQVAANFQSIYLRMDSNDLPMAPYNKKILEAWQGRRGRGFIANTPPYNMIEVQCLSPSNVPEAQQLTQLRETLDEMVALHPAASAGAALLAAR